MNALIDQNVQAAEESKTTANTGERAISGKAALRIDLPPDQQVLAEAKTFVNDRDVKLAKLAAVTVEDPVITLELLYAANAMFFEGDRPPISSVRTALVRLGGSGVSDVFSLLELRKQLQPTNVNDYFELLRQQSVQIAFVSQTIAAATHRDLSEISQTAGLMANLGAMINCAHIGERYVQLSSTRNQHSVAYKLQQDFNYDTKDVHVQYLRTRNMPSEIFFAIDRDLQCKTPTQYHLRFIVQSAIELVDAAATGRMEKYSPQQPLPTKSNLRMLKLSEYQYSEILDIVTAYLVKPVDLVGNPLQSEASNKSELPVASERIVAQPAVDETRAASSKNTASASSKLPIDNPKELFKKANFISADSNTFNNDLQSLSSSGQHLLDSIKQICEQFRTAKEAVEGALNILISEGPYRRAALVLLGSERKSAYVVSKVGNGFDSTDVVQLDDPLSPLALCLTKIYSYNSPSADDSRAPFGVTSYAISPIKFKDEAPIVLYADCGEDDSVPMEARKVFRLVVGMLNRILPNLPGSVSDKN